MALRAKLAQRISALAVVPLQAQALMPSPAEIAPQRPAVLQPHEIRGELGTFGGNLNAWAEFRRKFVQLVHANDDMDPLFRFEYLVGASTGRAGAMVGQFVANDRRYVQAWEKLCSYFDNPCIQVEQCANEIANRQRLMAGSASDMTRLRQRLQAIVEQLSNVRTPVATWSPMMVHGVQQIMDTQTLAGWKARPEPKNINALIEFLFGREQELIIQRPVQNPDMRMQRSVPNQAGIVKAAFPTLQEIKRMHCAACGGLHPLFVQFVASSNASPLRSGGN